LLCFGLLNCQSINNKSLFVNSLILDNNFDALVLTETWHTSSTDLPLRRSALPGYSIVDAPRPGYIGEGVNHGGVAILHRNCLSVRVINLQFSPTSFEVLVCHANPVKLVFVVVYRPSSRPVSDLFFDELTNLLEITSAYASEVIMLGDFNIHVDDTDDPNVQRFLHLLDAFGLLQHVTGSTHVHGHTLDLVITRPSLAFNSITVDAPVISDHALVTFNLTQVKPLLATRLTKVVRRFNSIIQADFLNSLLQTSVCSNLDNLAGWSVAELCALYKADLTRLADAMAPPVNIVVSSRVSKPWYDGECRAYCRRTRALERIYRRTCLPADCRAWSTALLGKRDLFATKEQAYWTARLQECSGNSKLLWRCLDSVLLRDVVSTTNNSSLTAQMLADFFISKVTKVRAATQHCPPAYFTGPSPASFNNFRPCSLEEIRRVIMQSAHKSCQLDPLPHSLLMKSLDLLLPFLLLLCNSSLSSGILPVSEKSALVTPIMKKHNSDPDSPSSYRPVSNLTFVSKLIERLVYGQLTTYLLDHHLLPPQQSAYRKHHSTETAMLKITSDIYDAADAGHVTLLALLDLSAAFDTVDHDILLQRLHRTYGIGGTVLHWIQSFLADRSLIVNFAGQHSTSSVLSCGVPQGSVTGPLLFNLYTADVISIAQSYDVRVHCYADDLQLYVHCSPAEAPAAVQRLLDCIAAIDSWMGSNRLKLNPEKTQVIWFGTRQRLAAVSIAPICLLDGTVIIPSTSVRSLGVILDSELTMAAHVSSVTRACFYQLRQLRFVRHLLLPDTAKMVVHSFIASRVDYCNALLYGATAQVQRKLQAVMNAAARLICNLSRHAHITPALRDELHWLPVLQRTEFKVALLVFKCLHGTGPAYLADYCTVLTSADLHHQLRSVSRGDLVLPRTWTRIIGPRSFRSAAPVVWNSLPACLKDPSLTLDQFKRHLKHHLFTIAYPR
jgi:hypothetical protein